MAHPSGRPRGAQGVNDALALPQEDRVVALGAGEPAVADDVGDQDRRELAGSYAEKSVTV